MKEQITNVEKQKQACEHFVAQQTSLGNCSTARTRIDASDVDLSSHVYLLAHRAGYLVKIGKANSIIARAVNLGLKDFDLAKSIGLRVATERAAFELERLLHTAFKTYRAPIHRVSEFLEQSSGMTEWFNADCMERAQQLLNHIRDLVPFELVEVTIPCASSRPQAIRLSKEEREIRLRKLTDDANLFNTRSAFKFAESFQKLSNCVKFIRTTTSSDEMFVVHFTFAEEDFEEISQQAHDMISSAMFKTFGGSTAIVGSVVSHVADTGNFGLGRFSVYRPYRGPTVGSWADPIEILCRPTLDTLRAIPIGET